MQNYHVDSFMTENCWYDLIDYSTLLDDGAAPADCYEPPSENVDMSMDISPITTGGVIKFEERESSRKRGRSDLFVGIGTKACRERERRGKLNDRFSELSAILEPGKPVKTEKLGILSDAIRHINQLKAESQEYSEMNKRLTEEIQILKVEKNELREEKLKLKAEKYLMEQQLKTMNIPPIYQAEVNKVPMLPSYGIVPMWQYLPPSIRDTSHDDKLRPPAA